MAPDPFRCGYIISQFLPWLSFGDFCNLALLSRQSKAALEQARTWAWGFRVPLSWLEQLDGPSYVPLRIQHAVKAVVMGAIEFPELCRSVDAAEQLTGTRRSWEAQIAPDRVVRWAFPFPVLPPRLVNELDYLMCFDIIPKGLSSSSTNPQPVHLIFMDGSEHRFEINHTPPRWSRIQIHMKGARYLAQQLQCFARRQGQSSPLAERLPDDSYRPRVLILWQFLQHFYFSTPRVVITWQHAREEGFTQAEQAPQELRTAYWSFQSVREDAPVYICYGRW